jgi:hypothetical protein
MRIDAAHQEEGLTEEFSVLLGVNDLGERRGVGLGTHRLHDGGLHEHVVSIHERYSARGQAQDEIRSFDQPCLIRMTSGHDMSRTRVVRCGYAVT